MNYNKLDKYYKRRIHAGSIIIIRPLTEEEKLTEKEYDYKILIMKRNPNIVFGGYYAFSGGKVEEQDLYDNWVENYPEMFRTIPRSYFDFTARVCAIRETFEEINKLIAKPLDPNNKGMNFDHMRELYVTSYKSNFIQFCKDKKIVPDLTQVYGYRRVSSGQQIIPGIDNQFYLYFAQNRDIIDQIDMEKHEFTKAQWLNPSEVLTLYFQKKLPILFPQLLCICHFSLIKTYEAFQKLGREIFDSNLISYSSMSLQIKTIKKVPQEEREKAVQQFCNEHDLKSDKEKHLYTINNPQFKEIVGKLCNTKSDFKELAELYEGLLVGTMPGDFFDSNDGYPILTRKSSRRRVYLTQSWELIRFEFTEDILEMYNKIHISISKL